MIPKIIHQIWVGGDVPDRAQLFMKAWRDTHPLWEYRLWDDAALGDISWFMNAQPYYDAACYVPGYRIGQLRADIARYEILHRYGGLYVDADTEPLRPVDPLLAGRTELAVAEFSERDGPCEPTDQVSNAIIACTPDHPGVHMAVTQIAQSWPGWRRHRRNIPAAVTGPAILTEAWRAGRYHVEPSTRWFPYTYAQVITDEYPRDFPDAYAVHHWEHIRELRRVGVLR